MSGVDALARWVGEIGTATRLFVRSSAMLDTNPVPADWTHITKIDPEDDKKLPLLYPLYLQHTSAVSIGGSKDVTNSNTIETFELLGRTDVPIFHEPSAPHHITEETWELSRFTAIPEVLNGDTNSLIGKLGTAILNVRAEVVPRMVAERFPWLPGRLQDYLGEVFTGWLFEQAVFEAYIIQNLDSAAAQTASVGADDLLEPDAAAAHARAAEDHLGSEVIYLEYSGTFGGEEAVSILESVSETVDWSRIWYGGGLYTREDAQTVLEAGADAVIVGNVFHEIANDEAALIDRAREDLSSNHADRESIRKWVEEAIEVSDTNAAHYLSTIPTVTDPVETAHTYLSDTVLTWLQLEQFADEITEADTSNEGLRTRVDSTDDDGLPGALVLREVLDDEATDLAREVLLSHLDDRFGTSAASLPLEHVAPD